jgi:hypothetical protein
LSKKSCCSYTEYPRLSQLHDIITSLILDSPQKLTRAQLKFLLSNLGKEETWLQSFDKLNDFSIDTFLQKGKNYYDSTDKYIKDIIKLSLPNYRYRIKTYRVLTYTSYIYLYYNSQIQSWEIIENL